MRPIATLLFVILCSFQSLAQQKATVSGTITDEAGKPLSSATVSLLRAKDSVLVKLAVSGNQGQFELVNIPRGTYRISVSLVGYAKQRSDIFQLTDADLKLASMVLASQISMGEVTVTAKKPFVESKIDRTVVNVEASPGSAGATAMDMLEKSPGITVNSDGGISLRGKAGVIVMLDGKPTYLSATDLANLLKNTPASALDQIEIMTNPSSKYDASGNSGLINIKTKKGKTAGFNGSFTLGASTGVYSDRGALYLTPKSQNSFNFNYRNNKINFFGNYNPNFFRGRNTLTIDRKFYNNGAFDGSSDLLTRFKFGNFNQNLKLGLDYSPDKKNTFGVVVSGFSFEGHPTPITVSNLRDKNGNLQSSLVSETDNKLSFRNFTGNLNWKHSFDTAGTELTADLDYVVYGNTSKMLLTTNAYNSSGFEIGQPLYLNGNLPSDISIWSLKSDFQKNIGKGRLEAGIKSSIVSNDNLVDYTRQLTNGSWVADARSNHFIYDENINAAYVNVNRQFSKWTVQTGLRVENTNAKGKQVTNDSSFTRNFTNLFPSAFLSYAASASNQITLSYSRRITRPNYQDLNPFTYFLDSLTYRVGNPYLLPQFTHNMELSYAYKSQFIVTANYNTTNDVISQIIKQNSASKVTYNTSENVAKFTNFGLSITAPFSIAGWWKLNTFTNVYNNHYKGIYNNEPIDIAFTAFTMNITNSFTFSQKKGFSGELSGFYRSKTVDQLTIGDPVYFLNIALQKSILKNKGTLRLNIRDPFAWQQFGSHVQYSDINMTALARPDIRQVTATFSYRFGKSTGQSPRRRSSGSQEEQSRVGQGNN